jgi:membrane protease YdiL (CAAX protease family)
MGVILYLCAIIVVLMALQSVVFWALKEPQQWSFGANSKHPKRVKWALKVVLHGTLISSLVLYPYLIGSTPGAYYAPLFPASQFVHFLYGEALALTLLTLIYAIETACKWLYWKPRFTARKAFTKSALSTLSSFTVVAVEEPFFRGIVMQGLLPALGWPLAIPLSAVLFSAAHFIRKRRTYWPAVGLAVLGLWLGVAFYCTGNLWLAMGLHSGGILSIGVHRCFLNYKGPEWLVGTQTFPIAGLVSIVIMLIGTVVTWFIFGGSSVH